MADETENQPPQVEPPVNPPPEQASWNAPPPCQYYRPGPASGSVTLDKIIPAKNPPA